MEISESLIRELHAVRARLARTKLKGATFLTIVFSPKGIAELMRNRKVMQYFDQKGKVLRFQGVPYFVSTKYDKPFRVVVR